jgi:hypothetical protein
MKGSRSNGEVPGSARVSRVGDDVSSSRTFPVASNNSAIVVVTKDCFGETPKPTRETRALPGISRYRARR